ncbi:MAG: ribosome small subunit-dependent GTPase A, partial [Methylococcaceae bacterium]|nr:ribosome small subunit-dependent GTPase A [Methylococcaceae bacterium]
GDKVLWSHTAPGQGRIEQILTRHSLLMRHARSGKTRPVAANIDMVDVIFAMEPHYDCLLIDQYLAICENSNFKAALVLNKADLPLTEEAENDFAVYDDLGYPLYRVSVKTGMGLDQLNQALQNQVSIFTGQSGVGKSSLTNVFIPDKEIKINTISASAKLGRHTTTAATLYHIKDGGDLIDSPGVAIFGLADLSATELAYGYREFRPLIGHCQFNDCRHEQDKGCAIRAAVANGTIASSRYHRYLKLKEKIPLKR